MEKECGNVICPECGYEMVREDGELFCDYCGYVPPVRRTPRVSGSSAEIEVPGLGSFKINDIGNSDDLKAKLRKAIRVIKKLKAEREVLKRRIKELEKSKGVIVGQYRTVGADEPPDNSAKFKPMSERNKIGDSDDE